MNNETQRYLDLLDRRISLLGTLAESFVEVRKDIVSLDLNGLEARIAQQQQLCQQVGALDGQLDKLQEHCATSLAGKLGTTRDGQAGNEKEVLVAGLAETRERMKSAQGRVKQLNATHQELLRRCRRTAGALQNLYGTFEATYAEPMHARQSTRGRA